LSFFPAFGLGIRVIRVISGQPILKNWFILHAHTGIIWPFRLSLQAMKFAGYILAFYLILLSAVPCCAVDNCPEDNMEKSSAQGEERDCGSCSPFFSCEGCAAATIAFEPAALEIAAIKVSPVYAAYLQTALPHVVYDFWQPPRLG